MGREPDTEGSAMGKTELVPVERTIVGDRATVRRALATQYEQGKLRGRPDQARIDLLRGGQIRARVTLIEERPVPWGRQHPVLAPIVTALAWAGGVVLAVGAVIVGLAYWVAWTVDGPIVLGAAVLALGAVVAVLFNRANHSGACPGLHCAGCKGH